MIRVMNGVLAFRLENCAQALWPATPLVFSQFFENISGYCYCHFISIMIGPSLSVTAIVTAMQILWPQFLPFSSEFHDISHIILGCRAA